MNPPFRLGPIPFASSPAQSPAPSLLPFNRMELALGANFHPGEGPSFDALFDFRLHPNAVVRIGFASNFSDRLNFPIQLGARLPLNEIFSLEANGMGSVALLFSQERQQGRLAEVIHRDGLMLYLGGEVRVNANLTQSIGVYFSASYQRELCGAIITTPYILPHTREDSRCENGNLFGLGAGIRIGIIGPDRSRIPEDSEDTTSPSQVPSQAPAEEPHLVDLEDILPADTLRNMSALSALTSENIRPTIDYVARRTTLGDLPLSFQSLVLSKAIRGYDRRSLVFFTQELVAIHQETTAVESYDSIERAMLALERATLIDLSLNTLRSLASLRANDRRNNVSFETAYANARVNFQSAVLQSVLNPFAQRLIRQYIMDFARNEGVRINPLNHIMPTVDSLSTADLERTCHSDHIRGCTDPTDRNDYLSIQIDLDQNTPDKAFQVALHENMHLFSEVVRRSQGCNYLSYYLNRTTHSFPTWMEEALNQMNIHAALRNLRRNEQYAEENNDDGRLAIERIAREEGDVLQTQWRSMHLFCQADPVRESIGASLFGQLTSNYSNTDHRGTQALQRVERYYQNQH